MNTNEMIERIIAIVGELLKAIGGKHDHITSVRIPVKVDDYFPAIKASFGCFIENLYVDKLEIMIPRSPICSYWDTSTDLYSKSYFERTHEDLIKLHASLTK